MKFKQLIPFLTIAPEEENPLHWLAILAIYLAIYLAFGVLAWLMKQPLAWVLDAASVISFFIGAVWTAAGVYYVRPKKKMDTLEDLSAHVIATFYNASRHCVIGLALIFFGNFCLFASKTSYVISLG